MAKDFSRMEDSNRSANADIHSVSNPARRIFVRGGVATAVTGLLAPLALSGCASSPMPANPPPVTGGATPAAPVETTNRAAAATGIAGMGRQIGFTSVAMAAQDNIVVPAGYTARVLFRWGDAVGLEGNMPAFKADASNTAAEQAAQGGMHHDGIHFFPLNNSSQRGLLAMNHEYSDDGLLHTDGMRTWSAEKVRKAINAHGVSVVEVQAPSNTSGNQWEVVRPSRYARRITAATPMRITGPAAGHPMMRTAADPNGTQVLGTLNNCAHGYTPWGTYLTCEENFVNYFNGPDAPDAHQRRWGMRKTGTQGYRWHEHEERFDAVKHPNEFNRFGWMVEIDPMDPTSTPIKRTALGRAAHEGAAVATTADGRAVLYMGEDARFEYIYKFVSRDAVKSGGFDANRNLLDNGTLYVARFNADGSGQWLALTHGEGPLTAANGFENQGEVVIKARQASDLLGATKMDRPEWTAIDPITKEVYCTLTNNVSRGADKLPGVDAANPRANNSMGHIIRWKEAGDLNATRFNWNHFVMAGDARLDRMEAQGSIKGDAFGSPDGIWVDGRGVMWIQTDVSTSVLGKGDYANLPNNQMLACDPTAAGGADIRRFLLGPAGCEVTGVVTTPNHKTMFVNIQHPGESPSERSDPDQPMRFSKWPDGAGRPRSATVVITKNDGGVIGT